MDFFEKLGDTITEKGKEAAGKARETAEILKLKTQISTCQDVVKKNYQELGRLYYQACGSQPEPYLEAPCTAIRNALTAIGELEDKIKELKG